MKKNLLLKLMPVLLSAVNTIHAQVSDSLHTPFAGKFKISTVTFTYKGRFKEITDSTITIFNSGLNTNYTVYFENIKFIKIRKPFPAIAGADMLAGLIVGTVGALGFLWYDFKSDNPMYPPFGRTVLWGMMIGAGGGLLFGVGEGMIGIRIPINRNKYISDKDRIRMEQYIGPRF